VTRLGILAAFFLALLAGKALAAGDVAEGQKVFLRCLSCHQAVSSTNKTGPYLKGVVGRPVAGVAGFSYSDAMKAFAATGAVWDEATLDRFLKDPMGVVPHTKMMAPPVRRDTERADLIAYLKTQM
jgi:cytochrome c